jgi:hypothetical protein
MAGDVFVDDVADEELTNDVAAIGNNNEVLDDGSSVPGRRKEPRLFDKPPAAILAAADDGVVGPLLVPIAFISALGFRLVNDPR